MFGKNIVVYIIALLMVFNVSITVRAGSFEESQIDLENVAEQNEDGYYTVNPCSSSTISNAITLESGCTYYREYSSKLHSRKWYSKFTIKDNSYAYIGFSAKNFYKFSILDEDGLSVYDFGSKNEYSGYFPLKAGTYYILLDNESYSSNYVVLSYNLTESVNCECEPNDTFSTATEIQPNTEYLIFSGANGNKDCLSFYAGTCAKVKIIVDNYENVGPSMWLYEEDRSTNHYINLKYDTKTEKYYYEFTPTYNGIYYIQTYSFKAEKIYGITLQYSQQSKSHLYGEWKVVEESTTSVKGVERRNCLYCDAYETRERGLCIWRKDSTGWWYQLPDGDYLQSCWKNDNNMWYHFNAQGYMDTGWLSENSGWYYLGNNGAMQTGWMEVGGVWYYAGGDGKIYENQWAGSYYLKSGGAMAANEWVDDGKYYVNEKGVYQTGWLKWNDGWYYLGTNGIYQIGWIQDGAGWYYAGNDGKVYENRWLNGTYYFQSGGAMAIGWAQIDGNYYYFSENGEIVTNQWVGNYYLKSNGVMATNEWVDDGIYYVGVDGAWIPNYSK